MAWPAPTCLLRLALLLHAAVSESNLLRFSVQTQPMRFGDTLVLKCEVMRDDVQSCTWLFQVRDPLVSPVFLGYLSRTKKTIRPGISNIEINRNKDVYHLTLTGFQKEHEGYYFCMVIFNQMTHFSASKSVVLTAPTTKPTTTLATRPPTRAPSSHMPPQLSARPEICVPEKDTRKKKGLDLSCDIYIWAPLAGTCAFLLLCVITVLICSRRHRRRVCKCPRPQVRLGGKSAPSERSV